MCLQQQLTNRDVFHVVSFLKGTMFSQTDVQETIAITVIRGGAEAGTFSMADPQSPLPGRRVQRVGAL